MRQLPDFLVTTNKYLIRLYVLSCASGAVSCVFFSLVWSHWHSTLNNCFTTPDCGCILYVSATTNVVTGGDIRLCTFITYTQLGVALVSLGMACYYCARSVRDETREARAAQSRRFSPAIRERRNSDPCLTPIALASALISILLLCVAYMYTEGYYKTCSQYRRTAARSLKASGNLVSLIYERLSCDSILDLMDYTHPNTPRQEPRGGIVNSAFLLHGAMLSGWTHFILWLLLLVYNTLLARRRSHADAKHGERSYSDVKTHVDDRPNTDVADRRLLARRDLKPDVLKNYSDVEPDGRVDGCVGDVKKAVLGTETAI